LKEDQAPSAILELVDGPKDMRFAMTARTVARCRGEGKEINEMTAKNIEKVTRFRRNGKQALETMVERLNLLKIGARENYVDEERHPEDKDKGAQAKEDAQEEKRPIFYGRDNSKTNERRWGGIV
jgi:hypothetical protein